MINKEDYKHIGYTSKPHGLAGELATKLTVDIEEWLAEEERPFLMLEEHGLLIPFRIEGHRIKAGEVDLIKFSGVNSKEEAEQWSNVPVWLSREYLSDEDDLSPLDDYSALVGYMVLDSRDAVAIGTIVSVDESTLNTLLEIERRGGGELLLPLAQELIASINEEHKCITLVIPEGLLTDEAEYDIH